MNLSNVVPRFIFATIIVLLVLIILVLLFGTGVIVGLHG